MYQRILVPLDGSALAERSLDQVMNFSQAGTVGEVILLNVLDPLSWCMEGRDFVAFRNAELKRTHNYLAEIGSRLGSAGINVRSDVVEGSMPASYIVKYAKDHDVDLIIIASHGNTGMKKMMFGSVALEVLHDSHAPVLLIKP